MSLLEIVIASAIMAATSITFFKYMASTKLNTQSTTYDYTAMNLARDTIEWGSAGSFSHPFQMIYYYPGSSACTLPNGCWGSSKSVGYGIKEWWYYNTSYANPFYTLGDVKAKSLVPPGAPESVKIYYTTYQNGSFDNAYQHYVKVSWQDIPTGPVRSRELSVISLSHVNDQLHLKLAGFTWKKE